MFKLKCDDFLIYDEATGTYSMSPEQQVRDETEKNSWKSAGWTILKDWRLYAMLIPMVLVYFLWKYMPMYELMACFKNPAYGDESGKVASYTWAGFDFFKELFTDKTNSPLFWRAFRNTFTTAFYGLLFGFPMPIILALFFNEVRSNIARSIMQVCVYLPKFLSTVIVTSLVLVLFRSNVEGSVGIVSKVFQAFGADPTLVNGGLVYTTKYYRAIYIITDLWEHAGYDSIVFFAAVIAVSPTSYEAAQIDGAGKMAQMRYVVIPSILSTVVIMLIMKIGSLLSVGYEKIYLLLGDGQGAGGNWEVADTVSTLANRWTGTHKSMGTAAEMLNNLIGMILVIGANKIARKASDVSLY